MTTRVLDRRAMASLGDTNDMTPRTGRIGWLNEIDNTRMRRRTMEKTASHQIAPRRKKDRCCWDVPEVGKAFLTGDRNGCVLVIPKTFQMSRGRHPSPQPGL